MFWKRIYKSKYTGAEIDAAVAKAGTVPAVTEADAGKALVVDEEGKIVAGEAGGGGTVYLESSYIETAPDTHQLHIKKTIEEISGLVSAGNSVILVVAAGDGVNYYNLVEISENQAVFSFNSISASVIIFAGYVFQNLVTPHDGYKAKAVEEPYYELQYTPSN